MEDQRSARSHTGGPRPLAPLVPVKPKTGVQGGVAKSRRSGGDPRGSCQLQAHPELGYKEGPGEGSHTLLKGQGGGVKDSTGVSVEVLGTALRGDREVRVRIAMVVGSQARRPARSGHTQVGGPGQFWGRVRDVTQGSGSWEISQAAQRSGWDSPGAPCVGAAAPRPRRSLSLHSRPRGP